MVIAKESFILSMKGAFLFEPWGQPHTTPFPHNWSEYTNYHILFPTSIVTSHSPIPIFHFFSLAMKNNPPYFSRKKPKSQQNSKIPSETLPRQSLCFTELVEPTTASVTGIAAFSARTCRRLPHSSAEPPPPPQSAVCTPTAFVKWRPSIKWQRQGFCSGYAKHCFTVVPGFIPLFGLRALFWETEVAPSQGGE